MYVIAAKREQVSLLSYLADEFSLSCRYFARGYASNKFTLRNNGSLTLNIDTALILAAGRTHKKNFFYTNEKEFIKTSNAFVKAVLPSVAAGASLCDVTTRAYYRFPKSIENDEQRGECLSAILGAYRAQIELCTAAGKPDIEFSEGADVNAYFASICKPKLIFDKKRPSRVAF